MIFKFIKKIFKFFIFLLTFALLYTYVGVFVAGVFLIGMVIRFFVKKSKKK